MGVRWELTDPQVLIVDPSVPALPVSRLAKPARPRWTCHRGKLAGTPLPKITRVSDTQDADVYTQGHWDVSKGLGCTEEVWPPFSGSNLAFLSIRGRSSSGTFSYWSWTPR